MAQSGKEKMKNTHKFKGRWLTFLYASGVLRDRSWCPSRYVLWLLLIK